jgi:O-antigen/teichoic acid export membrane protein
MNTVQRIAKNTIALYAVYTITVLVFLVLSIFIARTLGDVTFGKFSFAYALSIILVMFISLGYDTLIIRDVARDRPLAPKYLGNITVIKAILSVIMLGLTALVMNLMHYPPDTTGAVLIFGAYAIFTAFSTIFKATFRAFERMEYQALAEGIGRLLTVSLGLAALFSGYGLIGVACAFLIGSVCDLLLSSLICGWKFTTPKFEIDLEFWKKATKVAIPLTFVDISFVIFLRIDTVMLSAMKGDAAVGWYNAAYNLVLALRQLPFFFAAAVLPVMARLFISSTDSLKLAYEKLLYYSFIVGLPLASGTILLSDRIIILFYGEQFTQSIVALRILAGNILLSFLYFPISMLLVSINRQNQMAVAAGTSAAINVILNLILIPHFSYVGAGIVNVATQVILFGLYFYFASKYFYLLPLHKLVLKPIIACAVMATFIHFSSGLNLAVLIVIAIVIYFATFLLIRGFSREDIDLLNRIIKIPESFRKWFK